MPFRDDALEVAVVGMNARFPDCEDIEDWLLALQAGQVLTHRFSKQNLQRGGAPPSEMDDPRYVPVYGQLDGVLRFDRALFGVSTREAEFLDPQHRMMLETSWGALEDAGLPPRAEGARTGVFASSTGSTYLRAVLRQGDVDAGTMDDLIHGSEPDFAASRIAHKLALRGVALSVQTACSSSLVAVHLAVQSLLNGDCDRALVVASGLVFPQAGYLHQTGGVLSETGHCRPFDVRADGVVPGAGVVAVVLQLASAVASDAPVPHGVILATAVNNDGATKAGYYAPSVLGQREVIATAWQNADVDIRDAAYLEAHGTGTALGDPIEWDAASQAFRQLGAAPGQIAVGAVKANIGHLDAASGLAGLVKTLLVLRERNVPPVAGFSSLNPLLRVSDSPLRVADGTDLLAPGAAAGVSSFGIGGTNAHVVLRGWSEPSDSSDRVATDGARRSHPLALSAADVQALARGAVALADWLDDDSRDLAATADALVRGRSPLAYRIVVRATDRAAAAAELRLVDAEAAEDSRRPPKVALLFPGQGTHHPGMGRMLAHELPRFWDTVREVIAHFPESMQAEAERALWDPGFPAAQLRQTRLAQPVLFCVQYAAATAMHELGLEPIAVIGHSLGEISAAAYGGALSLAEAVNLVLVRGAAMQACAPGRMLGLGLPEAEVVKMLEGTNLDLAAVNGPEHCVVAGDPADVDQFARALERVRATTLDTDRAFHSRLIEPSLEALETVAGAQSRLLSVTLVSTVTAQIVGAGQTLPAGHFVRGAKQPVRFADALEALGEEHPGCTVVEVGPGRSLSALVELAGLNALPLQQSRETDGVASTLDALWKIGAVEQILVTPTTSRRPRPPRYSFGGEEFSLVGGVTAPRATSVAPTPAGPTSKPDAPVDAVVRAAWEATLGSPADDDTLDYFELGGDSLSMIRLLRRLEGELGARLALQDLMTRTTLAAHIEIAARAVG
ncbi:type I polyketide synthase [Nocardioides sp.]|uniref:type I polyketide synthase n=1 Tax=Nocardioides sp. TaxID=35761 RepID=UPI0035171645